MDFRDIEGVVGVTDHNGQAEHALCLENYAVWHRLHGVTILPERSYQIGRQIIRPGDWVVTQSAPSKPDTKTVVLYTPEGFLNRYTLTNEGDENEPG